MRAKRSQKEIKRWWNSKRNLRWDKIYDGKSTDTNVLKIRSNLVNSYLDSLQIKKGKILELGFGGGQIALDILKKCHLYEGIDVSSNFTKLAKRRCKKFVKNKKAVFKTGSIDKKLKFKSNSFDAVIAVGVLQYIENTDKILKEIRRVLKPSSNFIWAQTNIYKIQKFLSLRSFLVRIYYLISKNSFEVSDSLRSLLFETSLKNIFSKKMKLFFLKKNFINHGYIKMNYKFKKKIFSIWKMKTLCKTHKFFVIKFTGAPLFRVGTNKPKILIFLNTFIFSFLNLKFLRGFSQNIIIHAKK